MYGIRILWLLLVWVHVHTIIIRLKQCNRPLEQIVRRIHEESATQKVPSIDSVDIYPFLKHKFQLSELPDLLAYRYVKCNSKIFFSTVKNSKKDRWALTHSNQIVEFECAIKIGCCVKIRGCSLKNSANFFEKPFNSQYINISISDCEKNEPEYFDLSHVKAKLFCIPYRDEFVFIPLSHTL